jgi:hypothetical protein
MPTKTKRRLPTHIDVVTTYLQLDRTIKELEAERTALKPSALAALDTLGSTEVDGSVLTASYPTKTVVDLEVLRESTSPRLFRELTKPVHDLVKIRARLELAKVPPSWAVAITYPDDTPRIVITQR